jgi:hypothetical protein
VAGFVPGVVASCCGEVLWLPVVLDPGADLGGRANAKTRGVYPLLGAAAAFVVGVASVSTTVCSTATWSGASAPDAPSELGAAPALGTASALRAASAPGPASALRPAGALGVAVGVGEPGLLGEAADAAASAVLPGALSGAAGAPAGGTTGGRGAFGASDCSGGVTGWAFSGDRGAG